MRSIFCSGYAFGLLIVSREEVLVAVRSVRNREWGWAVVFGGLGLATTFAAVFMVIVAAGLGL